LKVPRNGWRLDPVKVSARFQARADLLPHTLADCLYELQYWDGLNSLRYAYGTASGDPIGEVDARDDFVFGRLATIPPAGKDEAVAVFHYLTGKEKMDRDETEAILLNLIRGGSSAQCVR
jgi:hypothetical protein